LPLVRRIVADLRDDYQAWRELMARYEIIAAGTRAYLGEDQHEVALRHELAERAARLDGLLEELKAVGCELKDFELGLVDFYALLDDRLVFLCWRLGEPRVEYWHEVDAGIAGRQPVDETLFPGIYP
ncbi:MAG: DUF2203 domain-containing protein, partial [Gemmatimonadota bacterium]|nr:DUF2203 domain-containing protein [Gemmatimonadota bacterium]